MVDYPRIHPVCPHFVMRCDDVNIPKRLYILRFIQWLGSILEYYEGTSSNQLKVSKKLKVQHFKAALCHSDIYFGPVLNIPRSRVLLLLFFSLTTYNWRHMQEWYRFHDMGYAFVGTICSYSSIILAIVWVGTRCQVVTHATHSCLLKSSLSHLEVNHTLTSGWGTTCSERNPALQQISLPLTRLTWAL